MRARNLAGLVFFVVSDCAGTQPASAPQKAPASEAPAPAPAVAASADPPPPIDDAAPAAVASVEPPLRAAPAPPHEPSDPDVRAAFLDAEGGLTAAAAARLTKNIARIDKQASLEDRMLAHALIGRRFRTKGNAAAAKREYDKVLAAWADPMQATKTIVGDHAGEREAMRRVGQALTAVGEALFAEAEQKRKKALALHVPAFKGAATDDAVKKYLMNSVADWMRKRRALESDAQEAYKKVLAIQPVPPPRWVIASAVQVGTMLEALPIELDQVPMPPSLRRDPKLAQAYRDSLHGATEPQRQNAIAAFRACREYSAKFQLEDEYSRLCRARLSVLQGP
jgi:tetratricopeptide (TPR) repeat protein